MKPTYPCNISRELVARKQEAKWQCNLTTRRNNNPQTNTMFDLKMP